MLPNSDHAVIEPAKVRDYLLSPMHPVGRFKATFFVALGYSQNDWARLRDDLLEIARACSAISGDPSPFGEKFEVRATLVVRAQRGSSIDWDLPSR